MLYIILCSFFSSTLACFFLCTSLSHLDKAILLTAFLVSCSYAYPRTSFKHSLRPLVSSPLTMLFLHTALSQIPLTSPWNCSPETTGLRNPTQNTSWREARLSSTTGTDSNQHVQPTEEDLHHTTTQCWNSQTNSYVLVWCERTAETRDVLNGLSVLFYPPPLWTHLPVSH